ncbi:hypothetical protein K438DRAFT_1770970 [Mycena galopus ATCC 62051]|nr:hypothetical protein K438DRAFT_1770970 [Mycena galopus ATCC 62051]
MPASESLFSTFIPSYGAGHVVNGTVSTWLAGVQLWHGDALLSRTRKGVSKLAPASSRRLPLDPVSHDHMSALRSALDLVRRKYPGFHREKRLRVRNDVKFKSGRDWRGRSCRRQCNANPRTIPTPPKTAYTNTMFEPHPYTWYIPVPDLAPHPQNQDIQTLPLLTPAERAWLAAQHDLARESDYWQPVRWLELGKRMYGEALKRGTLHDGDDERDGERGAQGGRETQGIAKGNAAWESVSLSRLQCDIDIHRFNTLAWILKSASTFTQDDLLRTLHALRRLCFRREELPILAVPSVLQPDLVGRD